jgi:hypothetical protein
VPAGTKAPETYVHDTMIVYAASKATPESPPMNVHVSTGHCWPVGPPAQPLATASCTVAVREPAHAPSALSKVAFTILPLPSQVTLARAAHGFFLATHEQ